jgi:hypothetical protein
MTKISNLTRFDKYLLRTFESQITYNQMLYVTNIVIYYNQYYNQL